MNCIHYLLLICISNIVKFIIKYVSAIIDDWIDFWVSDSSRFWYGLAGKGGSIIYPNLLQEFYPLYGVHVHLSAILWKSYNQWLFSSANIYHVLHECMGMIVRKRALFISAMFVLVITLQTPKVGLFWKNVVRIYVFITITIYLQAGGLSVHEDSIRPVVSVSVFAWLIRYIIYNWTWQFLINVIIIKANVHLLLHMYPYPIVATLVVLLFPKTFTVLDEGSSRNTSCALN